MPHSCVHDDPLAEVGRPILRKIKDAIHCVTPSSTTNNNADRQVIGFDLSGYCGSQKKERLEYIDQIAIARHTANPKRTCNAMRRRKTQKERHWPTPISRRTITADRQPGDGPFTTRPKYKQTVVPTATKTKP